MTCGVCDSISPALAAVPPAFDSPGQRFSSARPGCLEWRPDRFFRIAFRWDGGCRFQVRGLPCTAKEASNTLCGCVHKVEVYGSVLDRAL